jgi:FAD/FMN-containing dehydrogenase
MKHQQQRRRLLQCAATVPLLPCSVAAALADPPTPVRSAARCRPGDAGWPPEGRWLALREQVGGRLLRPRSPLQDCLQAPDSATCTALLESLKNPFFIGDDAALTQTLGWVDAWTSRPSAYAVAARSTEDVVAAVNFARRHNLRLVVKGGGHSYQGTSSSADSLLVWTRHMDDVTLHDSFVASGCQAPPTRAVTVGAGAVWAQVYDAVTTRAGGYVQGGGCTTVGVAGLVQSGGFGSFSKAYGLASASLLQAEVVTADGLVRIANACTNPELFWGLKGGGGGSLGIVTRLTLRVHPLPESFGAVNVSIQAASAEAFRKLIGMIVELYDASLMNPHWGEQIRLRRDNVLKIAMVFQGLSRSQAQKVWQPFLDAVAAASDEFSIEFSPLKIVSTSARDFWAPTPLKSLLGFIKNDDRPGAPKENVFWPGDQHQAAQVLHGFQSAWLSASLLKADRRTALVDALFAASRHWNVSLHVNKGLAGAPAEALAAARDTAMNPAVHEAFALVICAASGPMAYPGLAGREPDAALARRQSQSIERAMDALRSLSPNPGSYLSESNFFEPDWQQSFWGANYRRLLAVKQRYDPDGLFFVHHGVGSEAWSADGFERAA